MSLARTATLSLLYDGVDISADVAPFVLSWSYTDNASGKADDLSVTLEDSRRLWQAGWLPGKGARLSASIRCADWTDAGSALVLSCGVFEIDEVEASFDNASGDTVTLKAVSALVRNSARREKKTRAWESASLREVARQVAREAGLELVFDVVEQVFMRVDQREESDLALLKRLAQRAGANIKIGDGQLVLFEGASYDARPASLTLTRADVASARFKTTTHEIYKACSVAWHDPETKTERVSTFAPQSAPASGQVLRVNRRVESEAEAMALAKNSLREKNKAETEGTLELMGEPRLRAGAVAVLSGFGRFSGSYACESATHRLDKNQGYTTSLSMRGVLGY